MRRVNTPVITIKTIMMIPKCLRYAAGFVIAAMTASQGAIIVLDFEGLGDQEPVENFYDGGFGGNGSGPGTDFDITFSSNSLAIIDADAGGSGNFGGEPSPDTILFFLSGAAATLNAPNGFDTGFSLFYTSPDGPASVDVYDGLNATGNLLASLALPTTPDNGAPDPSGRFSPFEPFGVAFTGTALSVDFGGAANFVGFDDITFGSATPGGGPPSSVPDGGSTLTLFAIALFGLVLRKQAAK